MARKYRFFSRLQLLFKDGGEIADNRFYMMENIVMLINTPTWGDCYLVKSIGIFDRYRGQWTIVLSKRCIVTNQLGWFHLRLTCFTNITKWAIREAVGVILRSNYFNITDAGLIGHHRRFLCCGVLHWKVGSSCGCQRTAYYATVLSNIVSVELWTHTRVSQLSNYCRDMNSRME